MDVTVVTRDGNVLGIFAEEKDAKVSVMYSYSKLGVVSFVKHSETVTRADCPGGDQVFLSRTPVLQAADHL